VRSPQRTEAAARLFRIGAQFLQPIISEAGCGVLKSVEIALLSLIGLKRKNHRMPRRAATGPITEVNTPHFKSWRGPSKGVAEAFNGERLDRAQQNIGPARQGNRACRGHFGFQLKLALWASRRRVQKLGKMGARIEKLVPKKLPIHQKEAKFRVEQGAPGQARSCAATICNGRDQNSEASAHNSESLSHCFLRCTSTERIPAAQKGRFRW